MDNAARHHGALPSARNHGQVKAFVARAKNVGEVTVQLAPRGMKRARSNNSNWISKKGQISWTVEWLFNGSISKIQHRVLDSTTIQQAVTYHLRKIEDQDEAFKGLAMEELHFLIKDEGSGLRDPVFAKVDVSKSLGEVLRHRTVIEYPTLHVYTEIPKHVKLEQEYVYVQPAVESLNTKGAQSTLPPQHSAGNDFISFNVGEEDEMNEKTTGDEITRTAGRPFDLPVIDFDDLEVPYL